jgi:probable rRNA maturation factor
MLTIKAPRSIRKTLDIQRFADAASAVFRHLDIANQPGVSLQITDDKSIRKFNLRYRGVDESTDVLSFENAFTDPETGESYLGDILISHETAQRQAELRGLEIMAEFEMLLVHGLLHLNGFDHASRSEWQEMSALQDGILKELGNPIQKSIHEPLP